MLDFLFEYIIIPLIAVGGLALCYFAAAKIGEWKKTTDNDVAIKYLGMLDNTITSAVLATTQTYVEALKREGKFDLEAQKIAFAQTYDAVMGVLTGRSV